jgi:hypothetical protein
MPFAEQKPLSVISLATLRIPQHVLTGIESGKLFKMYRLSSEKKQEGNKNLK